VSTEVDFLLPRRLIGLCFYSHLLFQRTLNRELILDDDFGVIRDVLFIQGNPQRFPKDGKNITILRADFRIFFTTQAISSPTWIF